VQVTVTVLEKHARRLRALRFHRVWCCSGSSSISCAMRRSCGRISACCSKPARHELPDWEAIESLSVRVERLPRWGTSGLLFIGDAAHAMSPIGGVGINLAIQDAVATANALAGKLRDGTLEDGDLDAVRRRRLFPTRATQALQVRMQKNVLAPVISGANATLEVPLAMRVLTRLPPLQRVLARVLGMGVRPEHVRSPTVVWS
jgi:2-polyprenyl-6-methoxyphenol hydroxylase-like FAD-dependent oxidoreductase